MARKNPAFDTDKRKVPRRAYDFLRPHEVAPVLRMAPELYGPSVACAFALALYAGLRRGEVAGLKKGDIDLAEGTLTVRRSHLREGVKGNVEVVLPIHPELAPFLEEVMAASRSPFVCPGDLNAGNQMPEHYDLEDRLRRTMAAAGVGITGFVHHCRAWHCKVAPEVADNDPRPCPEHGLEHIEHGLEHIHVAARVRPLCFHDLRRSHASLLADAGVSTAVAQKLMRHSDPKLTERVYTVLQTETLRREVSRMRFLSRGPSLVQRLDHGARKASTLTVLRGENRKRLRGPACE
jgi:integrase